ncbi:hypothetical protein JET14_12085 [Martelella lutilitoris]|uniref:Uncharacterized protein n=1 Tax=Martelella lutilitoris TaxID=2583532 RepID=A0A7T7HH62_9HYPH|nr:hypothetical protein [Martelella lutilitoris]QQM29077.1 hypothetical protein JET14_12085 [Martelella lutilitoris]
MSLSAYSQYAHSVGTNLRLELLAEEYEPFLAKLSVRSRLDLNAFVRENVVLIEKVATSTPKRQHQLLSALSTEQRFWTIAAAAQMTFEASALLSAVELHLVPGCGYRDMIGYAQDVLCAADMDEDYLWPFPIPRPPEENG